MRKAAIILAAAVLAVGVIAADKPKDADKTAPIGAAGVLTENKPDFAMIWIDGEDSPVKFAYGEGFDKTSFGFPPKNKGVFSPDRVQFTCAKGEDGNKLLTIKRAPTPVTGTVTGAVLFSNDFWVAVKPKAGLLDGYAINFPNGKEMGARLTALQKGDIVTIKFHTDVERHRIDALQVMPPQPASPPEHTGPAISKPPTSRPEMLQEIIQQSPGTEAARQAQAKLKELGG